MWECGLKQVRIYHYNILGRHSPCGSVDWNYINNIQDVYDNVTPRVGVWIETGKIYVSQDDNKSLPVWECGLKHCSLSWNLYGNLSLPVWECGLKHVLIFVLTLTFCHSPCGSVDWNIYQSQYIEFVERHSPCGSVDWNGRGATFVRNRKSLPVWECGLKLGVWRLDKSKHSVTPRVGVWIETYHWQGQCEWCCGHSPCGSVDWNTCYGCKRKIIKSLPMWECGLKPV